MIDKDDLTQVAEALRLAADYLGSGLHNNAVLSLRRQAAACDLNYVEQMRRKAAATRYTGGAEVDRKLEKAWGEVEYWRDMYDLATRRFRELEREFLYSDEKITEEEK